MRTLLLALLTFGLGVYVGKPVQFVVQAPECETKACPYPPTVVAPTPSPTQKAPESTPGALPSQTPTESAADDREAAQRAAVGLVSEEDMNDWVQKSCEDLLTWIGKYSQKDQKLTIEKAYLPGLPKLRQKLEENNLVISEEGSMDVGNFAYYIIVNQRL